MEQTEPVSPKATGSRLWRILIPLAIVAAGAGVYAGMVAMKTPPPRRPRVHLGPLVETIQAPAQSLRVTVKGHGTVRPAEEIDLVPQVAGIVVWKSPRFESGGFFRRGELLAQIDPRDYRLAVEVARAEVAQSQYALEVARGEAGVARREWELIQGTEGDSNPLALHVPQLRAAEARLQAARARAEEARLRLERTELYAPFDGRVGSTRLDRGQYAFAGQSLARIHATGSVEVVVPVADEDLAWIELPAAGGKGSGNRDDGGAAVRAIRGEGEDPAAEPVFPGAAVSGRYAGRERRWQGVVRRVEGELDPRSRLANLVIEVADPWADPEAPLLVGAFVDVEIAGGAVDGVRALPRHALREGGSIWVAAADSILRVRPADLVHRRGEEVLVYADLEPGEEIVVSALQGVTDGMRIRVVREGAR